MSITLLNTETYEPKSLRNSSNRKGAAGPNMVEICGTTGTRKASLGLRKESPYTL